MLTVLILMYIIIDLVVFGCLLEWSFNYPTIIIVLIAIFSITLLFPINLLIYFILREKKVRIIYIENK